MVINRIELSKFGECDLSELMINRWIYSPSSAYITAIVDMDLALYLFDWTLILFRDRYVTTAKQQPAGFDCFVSVRDELYFGVDLK